MKNFFKTRAPLWIPFEYYFTKAFLLWFPNVSGEKKEAEKLAFPNVCGLNENKKLYQAQRYPFGLIWHWETTILFRRETLWSFFCTFYAKNWQDDLCCSQFVSQPSNVLRAMCMFECWRKFISCSLFSTRVARNGPILSKRRRRI